jgi:hypothetical protein
VIIDKYTFGEYPSHSKHSHDVNKLSRVNLAPSSEIFNMKSSRIVIKNVNNSQVIHQSKRPRLPLGTNELVVPMNIL